MKIILKNSSYYYAIDCETSRSSGNFTTIEKALANIQKQSFINASITNCTSEEGLLRELKNYPSYTLVEFIDDIATPYEYW